MDQVSSSPIEAVPAPSLLPAMGERCLACGAPLARDQRYCLECGERCGEPRLAVMSGRPAPPPPPASAPRRRRWPSASTGTTLVAGVGTLLLALGVGVEIGKSGEKSAGTAPPVRVVTVNGGGTATTASATATATPAAPKSSSSGAKKQDAAKPADAKQETVSPVITPSAKATPPPVVKLGSKGHGAGYKDGKFTGDFFGG